MRWRRRRPAMWAKIVWPFSSSTENVVLGKICLIVPKTSRGASLGASVLTAAVRGRLERLLLEPREAMICSLCRFACSVVYASLAVLPNA